MSPMWTATSPVQAARMLLFVLVLAVLAGCGQKGDLYRPGKSQKLAANSDVATQI